MTAAPTGGYASPPHRPQIVGCYRCGAKGHGPEDCRFRSASCFKCKQRGHIARACCRRESGFGVVPPERQVHALSREEDTGTDGMFALEAADSHIGHVGITQPIVRTLDCGGVPVNMQVDTGSPVSVITLSREQGFQLQYLLRKFVQNQLLCFFFKSFFVLF
ncbi:hypothetical protein MRX96_023053 [Rhipicephalus microplus]